MYHASLGFSPDVVDDYVIFIVSIDTTSSTFDLHLIDSKNKNFLYVEIELFLKNKNKTKYIRKL